MTLVKRDTLRPVKGGHRLEMTCGCAFLFERLPDDKSWNKRHVVCCNQRFADEGRHSRKQSETVTALPSVPT